MTEQELRQLVRDAIVRAGIGPSSPAASARLSGAGDPSAGQHPSFALLPLPAGDGPCLIEPGVSCNHCGYCKTYGH